jgi:hypothetical protein
MTGDECIQFISNLCDSENESLKQIGDHFKCVFAVGENSPSEELLRRVDEIDNGVKNWFPSRFAEGYENWRDNVVEFRIALESGVYENIEAEFKSMFSRLKDIWKMLLEFLPFLLMLTVNRMNKNLILDIAKEEFKNAISIYKSIYHENDDRENEEHNKVKLTIYLIQLFRKLHSQDAICSEFILRPLLKDEGGFNSLFPLRFDSIILLFSQLNDDAVEQILSGNDAKMLENTAFLSNWAILDITNTIMPIAENFFFVYIVSIDLDYDPYRATGISISGIGNPKRVYFRLLAGYQSDSSSLQEANLYLINRKKQTDFQEFDADRKQYLTPDDYMNLTPLMLYTTFEDFPDKRLRRREIPEQQELFVFYGYDSRNSKKFLKFLEFSGKRTAEIIKSEESQYLELFEEYESFSRNLNDYYIDIEKIIRQVVGKRGSSIYKTDSFDFIFNRTWTISAGHLSSLLRADGYDSEAKLKRNLPGQDPNVTFIEELFVSPKEEELLNQFVSSDKRGFIIVGKSGMGKSNLLCSFFLKQRRKEHLNIFIDARRLNNKNIRHFLKESVVERIHESWVLKDFDNYLQSIQENITIIIDGVNEFNHSGGAIGLLEEVCDFIEDPNIFENAKIIASCRTEIWNQYKEEIGAVSNILSDEHFFTDSGDAVIISGFEDGGERESLYSAYQKYYKLKPELYRSLSQTVKELIKQPFMMGLIAETYSNRFMISPGSSKLPETNKIPKKLDYFLIFKLLTERKKNDTKRLFSVSNISHDSFDKEYENCLYTFVRILYDKIVGSNTSGRLSDSEDKSDSIQVDQLHKNKDFKNFLAPFSSHDSTTIFSAVIQVGLIEKLYIDEYDYWGNQKSGKAYKFFHDQYTQFWLSAVYNDGCILGRVEIAKLRADKNMLNIITHKIENILERSKNAPVLLGGLFHWLYNNMHNEKDDIGDFFAILFNRLVESDSTIVHYFVGSFLHWLIEANIVSPVKLNNELVRNGSVRLRKCFYEHIVHAWPDISPHTLQAVLATEKDETLIREISDIFVNLFTLEPEEVIEFLDKTLVSFEKLSLEILTKSVFEKRKLKEGFVFAQLFITSSLLCNFSDPGKLTIIRNFLKKKYNLIINVIIDEDAAVIKGIARDKMYRILEDSGVYQWDQAIGSQGRNNTFFVEDDGLIQRDVLYDFYKYCVDFHNGDMERLSLDKNSEYMKMTLKMIEYRQSSIIGYVATQILAGVSINHMEKLDEIVDEILKLNSKGALFYGIILVFTLSILEESSIDHIFEITHKKFIPRWMEDFDKEIYNIITFLIIGAKDFDRYWERCENILSDIIDKLREKADDNYIENFGDILSQYLFLPNIKISFKICDYLLDKDLHKDPLLREFTLKVLASMLARSPKVLKRILDAHGIEDITGDVRPFLTEDVIKNRSQVSYKHSWSNFLNLGLLGSKKLRYLLIKNFLAGLVQANMVPEFVKEFRRLAVEGIKAFLIDGNDNDSAYEHLTVEEGLSSTECVRKEGGGVKWEGEI